ncbi:MAG: hypothetical protein J6X57_08615 [Bacteroidales bacterium]|nr:hypothetical protein [Bacteroidales bacterium]
MKKIAVIILLFVATVANGQKFMPNASVGELSFGVGGCGPMQSSSGLDMALWLNYSKYTSKHLGYRVGARYMPENMQVADLITFPVAFSLRTGMREGNESLAYGAIAALDLFDFFLWDNDNIFVDMMAAFLLAFVNRAEFFIGLTPGYILGEDALRRAYYTIGEESYIEETVVSCPYRFYCSAETGVNISWRIWRLTFNMAPYFQWNFLNNYQKTSRILGDPSATVTSYKTPNWYFGMNFSLGYLF